MQKYTLFFYMCYIFVFFKIFLFFCLEMFRWQMSVLDVERIADTVA